MMRAACFHRYGGPKEVMAIESIPVPSIKADQVLVHVRASSINAADQHVIRGWPYVLRFAFGWPKPKNSVLGREFAGVITQVGSKVSQWSVGDHVYGRAEKLWAEYAAVPADKIARKPDNLSWAHAGSVGTAAMTALQGIQVEAKLQAGQSILIIGASGGVGTYAVQIAKATGAEVTGVCSTRNVEMVKRLGADHVIDYTKERWEDQDKVYDCVFQLAGTASAASVCSKVTPTGTVIMSSGEDGVFGRILGMSLKQIGSKQKMTGLDLIESVEPLNTLRDMIEGGQVMPEVGATYPLEEAVDAFVSFESGAQGKIAIIVSEDKDT